MTRIVLVRHGESNVTVDRRIGGWRSCNGLSALGRQQAERLRDRWTSNPEFTADVLVASNYARAQETAEIIAPALGGLSMTIDDGFGEHDPGPECDGMSFDDFVAAYPDATASWRTGDPFATTFPGGETIAAFHFRVGSALRRVVDAHEGRTIVISCHGGVIDQVMRIALRVPSMGGFRIYTRNTAVSEFTRTDESMWRIERYNDAAHLAGLPLATGDGAG